MLAVKTLLLVSVFVILRPNFVSKLADEIIEEEEFVLLFDTYL